MDKINQGRILIIDDDKAVVRSITKIIQKLNIHADFSLRLKEGLDIIFNGDYDLVFLDVNLPDGDGVEAIKTIAGHQFPPQIIIMTAYSDPDGAELAIENGAWDYLEKPASSKEIRLQVMRALQYQEKRKQALEILDFKTPNIIGQSPELQKCMTQASRIIRSDANVLITGETGTGKELFAKAIHDNSDRRNGEFIVVDCTVLSDNLIESVLFGHEKGAFTGADRNRKGLITLANGGTLFLDEVGELPESIQSSFLRVLQEKRFRPVGSEKEVFSDFRVICATNKNLDQMVSEERFRSDLLFRLKTFVLELPPLKDRKEDIPLIAKEHIRKNCKFHDVPQKEMSPDFMRILEQYHWPGNVRELINAMETSYTAAQFEDTLVPFHLPPKIRAQVTRCKMSKKSEEQSNKLFLEIDPGPMGHDEFIDQAEKQYLAFLYAKSDGDIQKLLKQTRLSRTVLYRKLKKHDIR